MKYLTLSISNEEIKHQLIKHRANQFDRLFYPYMSLTFFALLYNTFLFISGSGHPVLIITSGIMVLMWLLILIFRWIGRLELATYLTVPYMAVHTVATVCVYKGWLPDAL